MKMTFKEIADIILKIDGFEDAEIEEGNDGCWVIYSGVESNE